MSYTDCISLNCVPLNKTCTVVSTDTNSRRLSDLGIVNGAKVTPLYKSMFGESRAYLIKGSLFALRKANAKQIYVEFDNV